MQTRSGIRHKIPSVSSKRPLLSIMPSFPLRDMYNAAQLSRTLHISLRSHFFVSGSSSMPSASNRLRASSRAHVCMLFTCYEPPAFESFSPYYVPRIWLIAVPNHPKQKTPTKAIKPNILPPFILVFLAWLHAKQPSRRRIVVVFMGVVAGGAGGGCREGSSSLCDNLKPRTRCGDEARRCIRARQRHCGCMCAVDS
jgi:hypothetical protein